MSGVGGANDGAKMAVMASHAYGQDNVGRKRDLGLYSGCNPWRGTHQGTFATIPIRQYTGRFAVEAIYGIRRKLERAPRLRASD